MQATHCHLQPSTSNTHNYPLGGLEEVGCMGKKPWNGSAGPLGSEETAAAVFKSDKWLTLILRNFDGNLSVLVIFYLFIDLFSITVAGWQEKGWRSCPILWCWNAVAAWRTLGGPSHAVLFISSNSDSCHPLDVKGFYVIIILAFSKYLLITNHLFSASQNNSEMLSYQQNPLLPRK